MATIFTRKGQPIQVDDSDYEALSRHTWRLDKDGYVQRTIKLPSGKNGVQAMHRQIMGCELLDNRVIDHANRNKADNRRENLRECSVAENAWNQTLRIDNSSGYKGVHFNNEKRKWQARIRTGEGKRTHLGYFDTVEDAHEFYCLAADMIHGAFANHGVA